MSLIGEGAGVVTGTIACPVTAGGGCVLAGASTVGAVYSADQLATGVQAAWSGRPQESYIMSGLTDGLGLSQQSAQIVYIGGALLSAGSAMAAGSRVTGVGRAIEVSSDGSVVNVAIDAAEIGKASKVDSASDAGNLAARADSEAGIGDGIATKGGTSGGRASEKVTWIDEGAGMSDRARAYDGGAMGSRSNAETQKGQAPVLTKTNPDGTTSIVRFDGVDGDVLIDRKLSVVTTPKVKDQAVRQSEALSQNGLTGRWEVPTQSQAIRAKKMFEELSITNITVKVVPE